MQYRRNGGARARIEIGGLSGGVFVIGHMQDRNTAALLRLVCLIAAALMTLSLRQQAVAAAMTQVEVPASPAIQAQLQAMNDDDCAAAKRADSKHWISTLASEYVDIEATGARTTYKDLVAQEHQPSQTKVTECGTKVSSVTRKGKYYYLYGNYTEAGIAIKSGRHYRLLERIRDTWQRAGGQWKQAQSLSYEYTVWIDGKRIGHHVLSKKAIQEAG